MSCYLQFTVTRLILLSSQTLFFKFYIFLLCVGVMCVCVGTCMSVRVWRSEDKFMDSVSPSTFMWILGIKYRLADLHCKLFTH